MKIRNRNYDPSSKNPENQKQFVDVEVPDIAVGSKDMQRAIEASESDRVLASLPNKLYAPLHAVAVDRYLGTRNFQRLGVPDAEYLQKYSEHGWTEENVDQMLIWNKYIMGTYGTSLYAFATMNQRTEPIFDEGEPDGILYEFKELNEILKELKRYQEKSIDRADRVEGGGARPLEKALDDFFDKREEESKEKGDLPENAIVIQDNNNPFDTDGGDDDDDDDRDPGNATTNDLIDSGKYSKNAEGVPISGSMLPINDTEMDFGVNRSISIKRVVSPVEGGINDMSKRHKMFHGFSRR